MNIKTKRLEIKPICLEDKEEVLDLLTDKTVAKTYMLPQFDDRAAAEPLFLRLVELSRVEDRYVGGVYLEGRFIGMINKTDLQQNRIEMGYAFLPDYYNHGYATETFKAVIGYLFSCGFESVLASAFEGNAASLRVMEKCAMVKQPYQEQVEYRGVTHTCIYYALSKGDTNAATQYPAASDH